jgi:hypothetical protein
MLSLKYKLGLMRSMGAETVPGYLIKINPANIFWPGPVIDIAASFNFTYS